MFIHHVSATSLRTEIGTGHPVVDVNIADMAAGDTSLDISRRMSVFCSSLRRDLRPMTVSLMKKTS
jgi:hypothetical protein